EVLSLRAVQNERLTSGDPRSIRGLRFGFRNGCRSKPHAKHPTRFGIVLSSSTHNDTSAVRSEHPQTPPLMRLPVIAILSLVLHASVYADTVEVTEVDLKSNTFKGRVGADVRSFRVRPGAEVSINGERGSFGEIEPGMAVTVTASEPG